MNPNQWKDVLAEWSTLALASDLKQHMSPEDHNLKYLGFPSASARAINSLESRLGVTLPPSYRAFLEASDGFRVISPFIYRLRSVADVDWFHVENRGWIEAYNEPKMDEDSDTPVASDFEYFDYTEQVGHNFREDHLFAMLQISDVDDGVMLLNPLTVTPDGEWEAWFFANWIPGAYRYASFAHMMLENFNSLQKTNNALVKPIFPTIKIPDPKTPRHGIALDPKLYKLVGKDEASASPEWLNHLDDLENPDSKKRAKSIRVLRGLLKGRCFSTRHPELVPRVAGLARSLPDIEARCLCIELLTCITPDGPVPQWLIDALNDPHPWMQHAALSAVYYFRDSELIQPIINIFAGADDWLLVQSAATVLSEFPDVRAIPVLAAKLKQTPRSNVELPTETQEQLFTTIAMALARYGSSTIPHLTPLLTHPDPFRRIAAIVALRCLGDSDSRHAIANLKSDPDVGVRKQAEMCDHFWGPRFASQQHDIA